MNTAALPVAQRRSRLQLIMLALLFAAPVISAWVAWKYAVTRGVGETTNAGELVQPARPLAGAPWVDADGEPLPEGLLHGRWTYLLLAGDGCGADCMDRLHLTRQLRISVNKDMPRVQRLLVVTRPPENLAQLRAEHHDLKVVVLDGAAWQGFSAQFATDGKASASTVYMVDPLGNLMMRYLPQVPFKGMLQDLRRLLKASQVG